MYVNHNIDMANENCDAKVCAGEAPVMPLHEILEKLNALSDDIRINSEFIDSALFPARPQRPLENLPDEIPNMYEILRKIGCTLSEANDVLMHIRDRL